MAKFYGAIGYVENVETKPGVFKAKANEIHIVADAYADNHFYAIRYAKFRGVKWKVTKVEVRHPRLILTLGGLYNGTSA